MAAKNPENKEQRMWAIDRFPVALRNKYAGLLKMKGRTLREDVEFIVGRRIRELQEEKG